MKTTMLSAAEAAATLATTARRPGPGSPLGRFLARDGAKSAAGGRALTPADDRWEAFRRIADPQVAFAAASSPPAVPETAWFYGAAGEDALARFEEKTDSAAALTWPVSRATVAASFRAALETGGPVIKRGLAWTFGRREFQAFITICDVVQEDALLAFVNRSPAARSKFDAFDLYKCYYRSANAPDMRWTVQRMKYLAPVELAPSLEDLAAGLAGLAGRGLIAPAGAPGKAGYAPSDGLGTAISLLNDCRGFGAIMKRTLRLKEGLGVEWTLGQLAVAAGPRALWRFDFEGAAGKAEEIRVTLAETTPEDVERDLAGQILALEDKVGFGEETLCRKCLAELTPGAKFCAACGSKAERWECPKCGASVGPGDKFCGECGQPLG